MTHGSCPGSHAPAEGGEFHGGHWNPLPCPHCKRNVPTGVIPAYGDHIIYLEHDA